MKWFLCLLFLSASAFAASVSDLQTVDGEQRTKIANLPSITRQRVQLKSAIVASGASIAGSYNLFGNVGAIRFPESGSPYTQPAIQLDPYKPSRIISTWGYETNYVGTTGAYDILFEVITSTNVNSSSYVTLDTYCPTSIATNSASATFTWTNTFTPISGTLRNEIYILRASGSATDTAIGGLSLDSLVIETTY